MGAGQSQISQIGLSRKQGLRVLEIRENSPLDGKVQPYFDFIIDAVSSKEPETTPKQILGKLTNQNTQQARRKCRNFHEFVEANQNTQITLKIVSTKYRNVYNVEFTPNRNWNGSEDLIGLVLRKERFDEAFDTYCPFSQIKMNSPVKKAGIVEGEFLIGCRQFKYASNNEMLENVYDRFYDKEIPDKIINLAVYNIKSDDLRIAPVQLARGWGDKGLMGCQFLQGQLNKFPKNLLERREEMLSKKKAFENESKIKQQLSESLGTSEQLVENLKAQRSKRNNHLKNLRNILMAEPPRNERIVNQSGNIIEQARNPPEVEQEHEPIKEPDAANNENNKRIQILQARVLNLEQTISSLKEYIDKIGDDEEL